MATLDKSTRKFIIIATIITLVLVVIIVGLDIFFYFDRKFIFAPYKPKVPDSQINQTKSASKSLTKNLNTYYCPNGCPDPATGKPADSGTLNSAILNALNSNFTSYISGSPQTNPDDWNYIQPTLS